MYSLLYFKDIITYNIIYYLTGKLNCICLQRIMYAYVGYYLLLLETGLGYHSVIKEQLHMYIPPS